MLEGDQYALFSSGYGFDGLVAGLLARGRVTGVIAGARLFGFLRSGGITMEMVCARGSGADRAGADRRLRRGPRYVAQASGGQMTRELFAVFLGSSIRLAPPLMFAAIGELISERAGVLNRSVEGMMLTGAFAAAVGESLTGSPWLGVVAGLIAVIPVALLLAVLTNALRANQIVTGGGINILILGATTLGYRELFGNRSETQIPGFAQWAPPGLGQIPVFGAQSFSQVGLA